MKQLSFEQMEVLNGGARRPSTRDAAMCVGGAAFSVLVFIGGCAAAPVSGGMSVGGALWAVAGLYGGILLSCI